MLHVVLALGGAACWPALAAPEDVLSRLPQYSSPADVLSPYIGYSYTRDDNVLGIQSGPGTDAGSGAATGDQSDTTRRVLAGLNVRKRISRQVLSARLDFVRASYDKLSGLDHTSKDLIANWNWHVGNRFEGNLGTSYLNELMPFSNFPSRERNMRTQRRDFVEGGWLIHPSWRLRTGFSRDQLKYEQETQNAGDRNETMAEVGVDYLARSGSIAGVQLRHTRGDLPNPQQFGTLLVDNSYDQQEVKAKINWLLTGKTQVLFLGGLVQRKHDVFPARDYSGLNARLIANWKATGKTSLNAGVWREIGALDDLTASYTLNQGFHVGARWDMTSKLRLDGLAKRESSDYSGTAAMASLQSIDRKDIFNTASLKLTYRATDKLQLTAMLYRKDRRSNIEGNNYPNSGITISSRYDF
jgi:exopolysaccharide biosynthesis operon protein EpsL